MRRLILFIFTTAVVLMSVGLASAAYRDGRLARLVGTDRRGRSAGLETETPSAEVTS
jgi:hypothetical protein